MRRQGHAGQLEDFTSVLQEELQSIQAQLGDGLVDSLRSERFKIKNPGIEWTRDTGDCLLCGTKKTFYIIQNSVNQS